MRGVAPSRSSTDSSPRASTRSSSSAEHGENDLAATSVARRPTDVEPSGEARSLAVREHIVPIRILGADSHVIGNDVDDEAHLSLVQAPATSARRSRSVPSSGLMRVGSTTSYPWVLPRRAARIGEQIQMRHAELCEVVHSSASMLEGEARVHLQAIRRGEGNSTHGQRSCSVRPGYEESLRFLVSLRMMSASSLVVIASRSARIFRVQLANFSGPTPGTLTGSTSPARSSSDSPTSCAGVLQRKPCTAARSSAEERGACPCGKICSCSSRPNSAPRSRSRSARARASSTVVGDEPESRRTADVALGPEAGDRRHVVCVCRSER